MGTEKTTVGGGGVEITLVTGVVTDNQQRSKTSVHGSGYSNVSGGVQGGVYGGGRTTISSTTTDYQTFFLAKPDGREVKVELVDYEVPCRIGHKLSLILAKRKGSKVGYYTHFYNHHTEDLHVIKSAVKKVVGVPAVFARLMFFLVPIAGLLLFLFNGGSGPDTNEVLAALGSLMLFFGPLLVILHYVFVRNAKINGYNKSHKIRDMIEAIKAEPLDAGTG